MTKRGACIGPLVLGGLLLAATSGPCAAGETGEEPHRIVILNATDPYLPAFLAIDDAPRQEIRARSRVPIELYAETLNMHRFPRALIDRDENDVADRPKLIELFGKIEGQAEISGRTGGATTT